MKKIFALALIATFTILSCRTAKAQVYAPVYKMFGSKHGYSVDTVTNTGTAYDSIILNGNYSSATIQMNVTKISGTLGGTIKIQACNSSLGGTTGAWKTLNDSVTVTNTSGTNAYFFQLPAYRFGTVAVSTPEPDALTLPYYIYRVLWTGTGTMAGSIQSVACLRLKQ